MDQVAPSPAWPLQKRQHSPQEGGVAPYHVLGLVPVHHPLEVGHQVPGVVVGDLGAVAGTDAVGSVHQHHGQDRAVPLRLNALVVFQQVLQTVVVMRRKRQPGQRTQHGEDVSRARGVFAAVQARAELADRLEHVHVVAAHEVLRQVDDCAHQARLKSVTPRENDVTSVGQRKYVFDVTSIGQRSSPWTCNSVKVEIKFYHECKLQFPCAQLMLRTYLEVLRLSVEFLG